MMEEAKEVFLEMTGYDCGETFIFDISDDTFIPMGGTVIDIQPKSYWDNEGCHLKKKCLIHDLNSELPALKRTHSYLNYWSPDINEIRESKINKLLENEIP